MKKRFPLILIACLCIFSFGFSQTSDLIISEYGEGTSNNKYIEIYNGTGATVNLASYEIWRISNGGSWPEATLSLSGNLADGDVYVVANAASSATILAAADITNTIASWNGDDAVGLAKNTGSFTLIDAVGTNGSDPGTGWDVAGVTNGTLNRTLVRKSTVCAPNTNWTASAGTNTSDSEWEVNNANYWGDIGSHTASCTSCTDAMDYANIQFPTSSPQTITQGDNFDVYTQAVEPGITDANASAAGVGVEAWIGYSSTNDDPSTGTGWTWIVATYNTDVGSNDEHVAEIGSGLAPGTYYYASRYSLNGCDYTYGGTGGNWNNDSVQLVVNPDQVDFCNVDYPKDAAITTGDNFNVYAQAYEPGVTNASSTAAGAGLVAWIGYNTIGYNHQPWNASGWTWVAATYDSDNGNNDQFVAEIGSGLAAGTYYFASRFQLNGSSYSYGGIASDNVGNFWDATNNNGRVVVTDPPLADVVITEIMYNTTGGGDDEWIEICNVSGSTQTLSLYTIEVNSTTEFTFPASTTIANGACITIALGDGGGGTFNVDCPFTPTYTNGSGTGTLGNTSGTIELVSPSSAVADSVAYDDGDGADGNGSSLHIVDINATNSDTGSNWQEVDYGGSHDVNSLVSPCAPTVPEINVEGDIGTFPDITSGDVTPSFLDNTRFTSQLIGSSEARSFRIQNLGGVNLTVSSVTVTGTNPGDFIVTIDPTGTVTPGQNPPAELEITFSPLASGIRTAIVTINNNDSDEGTFTFTVRGDGECVSSSTSISPSSGPADTVVTVSGTDFGGSTTASFNGVSASSINVISATEMEVTVPATATTGNLEIVDELGCTSLTFFTIVDTKISSCQGTGNLSDLVLTEITDATTGSLTYIEIYNGTGAAVNLGGYTIEILQNGATSVPDNSSYSLALNSVSLANNSVYVVAIGTVSSPDYTDPGADTCTVSISGSQVGNGELADQTTTLSGINAKPDKHDVIRLLNSGTVIDEFGVHEDENWMDTTGITGDRGFDFRRLNTSTLPNSTFDINDWNVIDWAGSGLTSCSTNDYSDIGFFDYSSGTPPNVTTQPTPQVSNCDLTASFTVAGAETYTGAGNYSPALTFQWFYSAPGDPGWTPLTNTAPYSGTDTVTLNISNTINLDDYQFYCQIRENDADCYRASNAVKLNLLKTTWVGGTWDNGAPDINTIAVINDDYNSASDGSFSACQLLVDTTLPNKLTVGNSSYVEVQNYTIINSEIVVETQGSFVQNANIPNAFTLNSGANAIVNKSTTIINNWYDYTYWSSPITDETVGDALDIAPADRRFWFDATQFEDVLLDNTDNTMSGSDDIDDNGDDWQPAGAGDIMTPGVGYAATVNPIGFTVPRAYTAIFEGEFNNSFVTVPIHFNGANGDNDWNFIGNPYPGAIDFDDLYEYDDGSGNDNSTLIGGAAYLWSHNSDPLRTNDGNEVLNFNKSDYAIITYMSGNTFGGDGITPNPNNAIPSGQGFFVQGLANGTLYFDNSMRMADNSSNDQFFRSARRQNNANRLWIDLISDNGVKNQILVAYVEGGTDGNDGFAYDAPRNLSSGGAAVLYTTIEGEDKLYAIQGKNPDDLNLDEIIPFGFYTNIDVPTIYTIKANQFEGDFLTNNTIYLVDKLLNIHHNLTESEYAFTSEIGDFSSRFEIVFTESALSVEENEYDNALSIVELQNGHVQFKVSNNLDIKNVKIYDALGRLLYNLEGHGHTEVYNLSNLSQAAYIAQVTLSNDRVITKKAIKRQ